MHSFIVPDISSSSSTDPPAPVCAAVAPESAVYPYFPPTFEPAALQQTIHPIQLQSQSVDPGAEVSGNSLPYYPPRGRAIRSASSPSVLSMSTTRMSPDTRSQVVRRAYTDPTLRHYAALQDHMNAPFPHPLSQSHVPQYALMVDYAPLAAVSDAQDPYPSPSIPSLQSDSSLDGDLFERDDTAPRIHVEFSSANHGTDAASANHVLPGRERMVEPAANPGGTCGVIAVRKCALYVSAYPSSFVVLSCRRYSDRSHIHHIDGKA